MTTPTDLTDLQKKKNHLEICQLGSNLLGKSTPKTPVVFPQPRGVIAKISSMVFRNKTPKSCNKSCGPSILSSLPLADPTTWMKFKKNPV